MSHFRNLVKGRRIELELSQHNLGKMLGYPNAQFICNIEHGRSKMPRKKLKRLCRGLLLDSRLVVQALTSDYQNELFKMLGIKVID
jgi:DNA-binding XRE family transcriptional regulator